MSIEIKITDPASLSKFEIDRLINYLLSHVDSEKESEIDLTPLISQAKETTDIMDEIIEKNTISLKSQPPSTKNSEELKTNSTLNEESKPTKAKNKIKTVKTWKNEKVKLEEPKPFVLPPPPPLDSVMDFPALMLKITQYIGQNKITHLQLIEILKSFGIPGVADIPVYPHHIASIATQIDIVAMNRELK